MLYVPDLPLNDSIPAGTVQEAVPMDPPAPTRILEMATGAWLARALAVAVRCRLFERARAGLDPVQVAKVLRCGAVRPARMMTDVLTGAGLLERRDGRVYPTPLSEAWLTSDRDTYLGGLVTMFDRRLYGPWGRLEVALAENHPVLDPVPANIDLETALRDARETINGLHGLTLRAGRSLARTLDFSACRRVLDLGGGSGAMSIALTTTWPDLEVTAVDHGPIIDVIEENARSAGVGARVHPWRANFFVDPLPSGFDVVILSNILHDWSPEQGLTLLRRAHEALREGGRVVVAEWMLDDDRSGPLLAALLSLCMLIETDGGENPTALEVADLMTRVGFEDAERVALQFPHCAVVGRRRVAIETRLAP